MKNKQQKVPTVRLRNSYVTTVVSISMVLFLLSLLGLLILNARRIGDYVKENIGFSVILKDNVREADRVQLMKYFDASPAIKSTIFISAEQAATELQKELGENFIEFLGVNPLKPSVDIKFHAQYANPDSIARFEKEFSAYPQVEEVYYQESMVNLVNENLKKISVVILAFSALLLLISIALFNNTIRLLVYSKRFIIKTMQLVGANRKYILRPFILRGILNGVFGSVLAIFLFLGVIYIARRQMPEILQFTDGKTIAMLILLIFASGLILAGLTTVMAVNKYLGIERDRLYY
ncbi:MAG: cell division protein FtsX [Bacteroidetes bacterium GWF2_49_14]|nr:MAG: cell division protein FtsX [Bacteroidetes bacterium GWF2_49_14]HBB91095.1 cell division protein FtsX [Bacteroidales bacterium]